LDIVQKIWAPLRKLFAPPGVKAGYGPDIRYINRMNIGVARGGRGSWPTKFFIISSDFVL